MEKWNDIPIVTEEVPTPTAGYQGKKRALPEAITCKCPSLHSLQMHRASMGVRAVKRCRHSPKLLTTGSSWVWFKCARQEELICIPQTIPPLTRKIKKRNPVSKKQMGSTNCKGTGAEEKRGGKKALLIKDIKSHCTGSTPNPSQAGNPAVGYSLCFFQAPLASLPWHTELISSVESWKVLPDQGIFCWVKPTGRQKQPRCWTLVGRRKFPAQKAGGTTSCCFFEDLVKTRRWLRLHLARPNPHALKTYHKQLMML